MRSDTLTPKKRYLKKWMANLPMKPLATSSWVWISASKPFRLSKIKKASYENNSPFLFSRSLDAAQRNPGLDEPFPGCHLGYVLH